VSIKLLLTSMNAENIILTQVTPYTGPVNKTQTVAVETPATKPNAPPQMDSFMIMIPLFIIGMYLLFIRPQSKKEKAMREALKKLSKGDRVVTRGGIWGTVVGLKDPENIVVVKIADDVKVEVSSSAIESINPKSKAQEKAEQLEKKNKKKN